MSNKPTIDEVLLALRDWGNGLAKQEFDDDPLPGMSPKEAKSQIKAAIEEIIGEDEEPGRTKGVGMPSFQRDQLRQTQRERMERYFG